MTATNHIEECLGEARAVGRCALLPYLTCGFPDRRTTAELIVAADAAGAAVVEIGAPYSDSIADGPVIQNSFNEALARGHRVSDFFDVVREVRSSVRCALAAMLSYSIVHRVGVERFMERSDEAGFDGIILPDVPLEESGLISAAARGAGLCHIGLIAPTTSADRREKIASVATGFIYQIAAAGTTGERADLPATLGKEVDDLRRHTRLPICVGFGISNAAQVRAVAGIADGAIVGSAIIRRIEEAAARGADPKAIVAVVTEFLTELSTGLMPCALPR